MKNFVFMSIDGSVKVCPICILNNLQPEGIQWL